MATHISHEFSRAAARDILDKIVSSETVAKVNEILGPVGTKFKLAAYCAVAPKGVGDPSRMAYLDWVDCEFVVATQNLGKLGGKQVETLVAQLGELAQVMFRLDLAGAPVKNGLGPRSEQEARMRAS